MICAGRKCSMPAALLVWRFPTKRGGVGRGREKKSGGGSIPPPPPPRPTPQTTPPPRRGLVVVEGDFPRVLESRKVRPQTHAILGHYLKKKTGSHPRPFPAAPRCGGPPKHRGGGRRGGGDKRRKGGGPRP